MNYFTCPRCGNTGFPSLRAQICTACANAILHGYIDPAPQHVIDAENKRREYALMRRRLDQTLKKLFGGI